MAMERKYTEEEIEAQPSEYLRSRMRWANKAFDNQQQSRKAGKKKKKDTGSLLEQHYKRMERMDKKNIPHHRRSYAIPKVLLVQLLQAGLSRADIARILKVHRSTITKNIKQHNLDPAILTAWSKHKADVLAATEIKLIEAINDEEKIEKATLRDCATSFKLIHEAGRQEKGLGTGEININVMTTSLADLDKQERELREKLAALSGGKVLADDAEIVPKAALPEPEPKEKQE